MVGGKTGALSWRHENFDRCRFVRCAPVESIAFIGRIDAKKCPTWKTPVVDDPVLLVHVEFLLIDLYFDSYYDK